MEKLVSLLLEHPEAFTWSEIPCCLLGLLDAETDARLSHELHRHTSDEVAHPFPRNVCGGPHPLPSELLAAT